MEGTYGMTAMERREARLADTDNTVPATEAEAAWEALYEAKHLKDLAVEKMSPGFKRDRAAKDVEMWFEAERQALIYGRKQRQFVGGEAVSEEVQAKKVVRLRRVEAPETRDVESSKNFEFRSKRVLLTYKGHLDKMALKSWFEGLECCRGKDLVLFRVAHETGDEGCPYLHSHVVIEWSNVVRSRSARVFDYEGVHPNITTPRRGASNWDRMVRYLGKEDPENEDLLSFSSTGVDYGWLEDVESAKTVGEAVRLAATPSQVPGIMAAWKVLHDDMEGEFEELVPERDLSPWQRQLLALMDHATNLKPCRYDFTGVKDENDTPVLLQGDPSIDSRVNVVYNPGGQIGKTYLGKVLSRKYPRRVLSIQGVPQVRDLATIVDGALQQGWTGDTVVFNLTREHADYKIYNSIESMSDGLMTSQKYMGRCFQWNTRNVVVMTNQMLDLRRLTLSRWRVYRVNALCSPLVPLDLDTCLGLLESERITRGDYDEEHRGVPDGALRRVKKK